MTDTHIQRHTHTERERNIYTEKNTLRYILTLRETHIQRDTQHLDRHTMRQTHTLTENFPYQWLALVGIAVGNYVCGRRSEGM